MSANDRTSVGSGSAEWRTPPELFARLNCRFQFDYDAFASHEDALVVSPWGHDGIYSTIEGTFTRTSGYGQGGYSDPVGVEVFKESDSDGLTFSWAGRRVFMNPPYSRGLIDQCIEKAYEERNNAAIIVALIPSATETRWFQRFILPHCHIDWLPKRVRYIDPTTGEPGGSPPSGAVVATFKADLQART